MPDTKLRPTSTIKSKDKSSKQTFGLYHLTKNPLFVALFFTNMQTDKSPNVAQLY